MAKFNLVTIIDTAEEVIVDVETAIADFHKALAASGHKVTAATLTGDAGQTKLPIPEPVVKEPVAPVVSAPTAKTATPTKSTLDDLASPVKRPTWGE